MTTNAKLREAMLKAARQGAQAADSGVNRLTANAGEQWLDAIAKETVEHIRRAIASAGYQVVPVEPTEKMLVAAEEDENDWRKMPRQRARYRLHWDAMLAAAKEEPMADTAPTPEACANAIDGIIHDHVCGSRNARELEAAARHLRAYAELLQRVKDHDVEILGP